MSETQLGLTTAEALANIEESKRSGILKAMADSGLCIRSALDTPSRKRVFDTEPDEASDCSR